MLKVGQAKTAAIFMKPLFTKGHAWSYQVTYTEDSWTDDISKHEGTYTCTVTDTLTMPKVAVSKVKCTSKSKDIHLTRRWAFDGIFIGKKNGVWLLGWHLVGPARLDKELEGESTWPPKRAVINSTVRRRRPFYAAGQRQGRIKNLRNKRAVKSVNPYEGPSFEQGAFQKSLAVQMRRH